MSIRFNHPQNTVTATSSITIEALGGTPSSPNPIRLRSSSVILPNRQLPSGEAGALVFDIDSKSMKYHNGTSWVDVLPQEVVLAPIYNQLQIINNTLGKKIETVTYSSNNVASASVSGTNLNIVFPLVSGGGGTDVPGLFTSLPKGSITYYALSSGQNVTSIREQMSGVTGGQNGRNGSQGAPWVTKSGMCFADGQWWTWNGDSGTVTQQVPNLNQGIYLKTITTSGVTNLGVFGATGSITYSSVAFPQHYHGTGMVMGLSGSSADDASFIYGKTWNDGRGYTGLCVTGDSQYRMERAVNGNDSRVALSTTYAIYEGSTDTNHTHNLQNVDVAHHDVAVLYNIATPSTALNQSSGDKRYVLKTGDEMSGSLTIANSVTVKTNDANAVLWFRNSGNTERAAIFHNTADNTLRLRSSSGSEIVLNSGGQLTTPSLNVVSNNALVAGKNIVRAVNNTNADANGNVTLPATATASLNQNGWWEDKNTGLIYQWGYAGSTGNDISINFPRAFPNSCFGVTLGQVYNSHNNQDKTARLMNIPTTSGFILYMGTSETGCFWQAIGR